MRDQLRNDLYATLVIVMEHSDEVSELRSNIDEIEQRFSSFMNDVARILDL